MYLPSMNVTLMTTEMEFCNSQVTSVYSLLYENWSNLGDMFDWHLGRGSPEQPPEAMLLASGESWAIELS